MLNQKQCVTIKYYQHLIWNILANIIVITFIMREYMGCIHVYGKQHALMDTNENSFQWVELTK